MSTTGHEPVYSSGCPRCLADPCIGAPTLTDVPTKSTSVSTFQMGLPSYRREACLSIISVLRRLHDTNDPDREVDCSQQQQLRAVIEPRDPLLVRILFGGLLGALPKSRVDDIAAVLYDMIHVSFSDALLALCMHRQ